MNNNSGMPNGLFNAFLDWLYSSGNIVVPSEFHDRCSSIKKMLDNDVTGIINTVIDYSINSASDSKFSVESDNPALEELLDLWLKQININLNGIPTGLNELAKEYYKERWQGSSLCLLRAKDWKTITIGENKIEVPMTLWFVNGASVYVKRENELQYKLGTDKYSLSETMKDFINNTKNENYIVQKPYDRWFTKEATPYLVRKGVLKNFLAIETIQEKADEVISKVLPYLFVIEKGTQEMYNKDVTYSDKELGTLVEVIKEQFEKFRNEKGLPANAVPFDQKYSHLIPDMAPMLKEELYNQGYRALLAGLGFIDVIQGISNTRKESVLNPKPFIAEVNAGVDGFKSILMDLVKLIIERNKDSHRKLFSDNNTMMIVSSPLRINVEVLLEMIRSAYDRGPISIQSYLETLGFNYQQEKERREKEAKNGDETTFYPHVINNQEEKGKDTFSPSKPKNEKNENQNKKKNSPESKNFQADIKDNLIEAPYQNLEDLPKAVQKYPKHAQEIWRNAFNEALKEKPNDEAYAFRVAWSALQKYMKKQEKK